jgi:hypothetical protein
VKALLALLAACSHPHIESCGDDLGGVWIDGDRKWFVLDEDKVLEVFPLFADTAGSGAPRVIDLTRVGERLDGTLHRRYERRAQACEAHLPIHVTACKDDRLEVVASEPMPPIGWEPCQWPSIPSQVLRWQR